MMLLKDFKLAADLLVATHTEDELYYMYSRAKSAELEYCLFWAAYRVIREWEAPYDLPYAEYCRNL